MSMPNGSVFCAYSQMRNDIIVLNSRWKLEIVAEPLECTICRWWSRASRWLMETLAQTCRRTQMRSSAERWGEWGGDLKKHRVEQLIGTENIDRRWTRVATLKLRMRLCRAVKHRGTELQTVHVQKSVLKWYQQMFMLRSGFHHHVLTWVCTHEEISCNLFVINWQKLQIFCCLLQIGYNQHTQKSTFCRNRCTLLHILPLGKHFVTLSTIICCQDQKNK